MKRNDTLHKQYQTRRKKHHTLLPCQTHTHIHTKLLHRHSIHLGSSLLPYTIQASKAKQTNKQQTFKTVSSREGYTPRRCRRVGSECITDVSPGSTRPRSRCTNRRTLETLVSSTPTPAAGAPYTYPPRFGLAHSPTCCVKLSLLRAVLLSIVTTVRTDVPFSSLFWLLWGAPRPCRSKRWDEGWCPSRYHHRPAAATRSKSTALPEENNVYNQSKKSTLTLGGEGGVCSSHSQCINGMGS